MSKKNKKYNCKECKDSGVIEVYSEYNKKQKCIEPCFECDLYEKDNELEIIKSQIKDLQNKFNKLEKIKNIGKSKRYNDLFELLKTHIGDDKEELTINIIYDLEKIFKSEILDFICGFSFSKSVEKGLPEVGLREDSDFFEFFDHNDFADIGLNAFTLGYNSSKYERLDFSLLLEYIIETPKSKNTNVRNVISTIHKKSGIQLDWDEALTIVEKFIIYLEDKFIKK